jgi:DNA-binding transcriptional ArsR family regulator
MKTLASTNGLAIEIETLKNAATVYRAINHKLRQQMMRLIHQKGSITVTEIYRKLRLEQSVASQHLGILRRAAFVKTERAGKQIYYSVNMEKLNIVQQITEVMLLSVPAK